ncbi:MAG: hypothetical protein AAF493_02540 [Pseudomonadota bacterium]
MYGRYGLMVAIAFASIACAQLDSESTKGAHRVTAAVSLSTDVRGERFATETPYDGPELVWRSIVSDRRLQPIRSIGIGKRRLRIVTFSVVLALVLIGVLIRVPSAHRRDRPAERAPVLDRGAIGR